MNTQSIINLFDTITYNNKEALNIFTKYDILVPYKSSNIYYVEYIVGEKDRWDTISYKFYGTPTLWWVIALFNDIKDPFQELNIGDTLKIISSNFLPEILLALRKIRT